MEIQQKQSEARPGFRVAAGIISVLVLATALPMSVVVAVRGDSTMWLVAFPSLVAGIGFATVAFTGHWFCFRKARHEQSS